MLRWKKIHEETQQTVMCLGRYIVLTSCLGNGVPWSCRPVIFWRPVEIGVLICVIKCLQSWHLWWHRHIFLMNFKIDVVVACAAGAMTGLSLGMCWELHHHYIMCRPRKRGWRSQAIYQHSLLIYSWPLHSEPLLAALKYRSEIIAPSRPRISVCDRHGGTRVLPECDGFVPGCNPLSYFYLFFSPLPN